MQENPIAVTDEKIKKTTDEMKYPTTLVCAVISRAGSTYITFAHDFPKNVATATAKKVFYIGLPPQPAINVTLGFDKSSTTDWAIPYAYITDATMMNMINTYSTSMEIELTYS